MPDSSGKGPRGRGPDERVANDAGPHLAVEILGQGRRPVGLVAEQSDGMAEPAVRGERVESIADYSPLTRESVIFRGATGIRGDGDVG